MNWLLRTLRERLAGDELRELHELRARLSRLEAANTAAQAAKHEPSASKRRPVGLIQRRSAKR